MEFDFSLVEGFKYKVYLPEEKVKIYKFLCNISFSWLSPCFVFKYTLLRRSEL